MSEPEPFHLKEETRTFAAGLICGVAMMTIGMLLIALVATLAVWLLR